MSCGQAVVNWHRHRPSFLDPDTVLYLLMAIASTGQIGTPAMMAHTRRGRVKNAEYDIDGDASATPIPSWTAAAGEPQFVASNLHEYITDDVGRVFGCPGFHCTLDRRSTWAAEAGHGSPIAQMHRSGDAACPGRGCQIRNRLVVAPVQPVGTRAMGDQVAGYGALQMPPREVPNHLRNRRGRWSIWRCNISRLLKRSGDATCLLNASQASPYWRCQYLYTCHSQGLQSHRTEAIVLPRRATVACAWPATDAASRYALARSSSLL